MRKMRKQCADCRTVTNAVAPYCEACGYVFSTPARPAMARDLKIFLSALAMAAITIVVIGFVRVL